MDAVSPRMEERPVVIVTGAAGGIGSALVKALRADYRVVGLDRDEVDGVDGSIVCDLTSEESLRDAMRQVREQFGPHVASVVHLAAYFDFTGKPNPLYQKVNVEGTRNLLRALRALVVEQFIYSGTMLVHAPTHPGERIDERTPVAPKWAYPKSKAAAEAAIREERNSTPTVFLHLAGLYDERQAVPTLAHQIARIYERDPHSHLYAGDLEVGQSFIHLDDMIDAFRRAIARRRELPEEVTILVGEPEALSYRALQDRLAKLIHGESEWPTLALPKKLAAAGAWLEEKMEPLVPDAFDEGQKPFIRPFMAAMGDDHYALDIGRARELLGWEPKHRIAAALPRIVAELKSDPLGWYRANKVETPPWMDAAAAAHEHPHRLRARHDERYAGDHAAWRWAAFINVALGTWLFTAPPILGYGGWLAWSDALSGLAVVVLGLLALSPRHAWARWAAAAVGTWVIFAPLAAWTPSAAAYANDTLVGALVVGFAVLSRPVPGIDPVAALHGPIVPTGWDYSPSSWTQRLPIIVLAFIGLYVSRDLAAYQLGHIDGVWEPFFAGGADPKNGTEEIITSWVSDAWPVSDAGIGALTYILEILTGIIGGRDRWRTMPWLVILFGIMIVPLGVVSITFIIIQPILLDTWCTLCLIAAAAMLAQIPYSLDELVATGQFLARRHRAGRPLLRVFLVGDTDEGGRTDDDDEFDRPARAVLADVVAGGVNVPWNLGLCLALGIWLMFTRVTLGADGPLANADHLIGALVLTTTAVALAEVARPVRALNVLFALALMAAPFVYPAGFASMVANPLVGVALIVLSIPRGAVNSSYGAWNRLIV